MNIKRRVEASDKNSSVSKLGIRWNASSVNSSPAAFSLEDFEGSVHRSASSLASSLFTWIGQHTMLGTLTDPRNHRSAHRRADSRSS